MANVDLSKLKAVRFARNVVVDGVGYNGGEVASFVPDVADKIVRRGHAEHVELYADGKIKVDASKERRRSGTEDLGDGSTYEPPKTEEELAEEAEQKRKNLKGTALATGEVYVNRIDPGAPTPPGPHSRGEQNGPGEISPASVKTPQQRQKEIDDEAERQKALESPPRNKAVGVSESKDKQTPHKK